MILFGKCDVTGSDRLGLGFTVKTPDFHLRDDLEKGLQMSGYMKQNFPVKVMDANGKNIHAETCKNIAAFLNENVGFDILEPTAGASRTHLSRLFTKRKGVWSAKRANGARVTRLRRASSAH